MNEYESHGKGEFMKSAAFDDLVNSMIQSEDAQIGMIPGEDFDMIETVCRLAVRLGVGFFRSIAS